MPQHQPTAEPQCLGTTPLDPVPHLERTISLLARAVNHLELAGETRYCQIASDLNYLVRAALKRHNSTK